MIYGDAGEEEERLAFLDKVFEMGCTFWDTAGGCSHGMTWVDVRR